MKKFIVLGGVVVAFFVSSLTVSAASVSYNDNYYGGLVWQNNAVAQPDLVGDASHYDISKMDIDITGSKVTIDIYSRYLDNIGQSASGPDGTELGTLFLSTDHWTPFGTAANHYNRDVLTNGEDWEFALVLDNPSGSATSGFLSLYSVEEKNIITANAGLTPSGFKPGQEVIYDGTNDTVESLSFGKWHIDFGLDPNSDLDDFLRFEFDNTTIGLDLSEFAVRWQMTCANDIIEGGTSEVPEPATMLLFGIGIFGLAGNLIRRKK